MLGFLVLAILARVVAALHFAVLEGFVKVEDTYTDPCFSPHRFKGALKLSQIFLEQQNAQGSSDLYSSVLNT